MTHLPDSWVEALFAKLTLRYGVAFLRQYPDLDPALVKADWAEVLGCFAGRPEAIRVALESLPAERPVTALQFRALGIGSIREERQPALPAPMGVHPPDAVREKLATVSGVVAGNHPHAWAHGLKARQAQGEKLSVTQRDALARFDAATSLPEEAAA